MKVGILTFHRAINYGAVLQTFALQKVLSRYCECEVIDYRCKYIENLYKPFNISKDRFIRSLISTILKYRSRKIKMIKFYKFLDNNVKLSPSFNKSDLKNIEDNYDVFITGSDQVWNNSCAGFDKTYFLDFVSDKRKKNSYAASFGFNKIPNHLEQEYFRLLQGYNNISVREKSGSVIIKCLLGRNVSVHIDPTFLLTKEEWQEYAYPIHQKKKYILLYSVLKPDKILDYATRLSRETGYKIIYINDSPIKKINAQYLRCSSPEEFLGLFNEAEYVITNSFHGTVFSIIFEKKFFAEVNSKGKMNYRIIDLLEKIGLENRIITNYSTISNELIDYKKVNKKIGLEKQKAFSYLKSIIRIED